MELSSKQWLYFDNFNLGTGQGFSVLEVVKGFEQATGITIPYNIVERRPGDVPRLEACPKRAEKCLGWTPSGLLLRCVATAGPGNPPIPNGYQRVNSRLSAFEYPP